jgi:hypothetical protein
MEILSEIYRSAKAWDTRLNEERIERITKSLEGSDGDEARLKLWNEMEYANPSRSKDSLVERLFY